MYFLSNSGSSGGGALTSGMGIILYLVFFAAIFYFLLIRPQKKQRNAQANLLSSLAVGDSIMTTSGFFGTVIDMPDEDTVIVEFGNNKNCRIPMHKRAIAEVEKPENALVGAEEDTNEENDKKEIKKNKK